MIILLFVSFSAWPDEIHERSLREDHVLHHQAETEVQPSSQDPGESGTSAIKLFASSENSSKICLTQAMSVYP